MMSSPSKNRLENVAIVGAGGNMGSHIVKELLKTNQHTITAVTRSSAQADVAKNFPPGVLVAEVDYDDHQSLVNALRGQDVLVILMSVFAPLDAEKKLIRAAADAEVPWILPSQWAGDPKETELGNDMFSGPDKKANRDLIEELGKSNWIGMCAGFWYEFSLAGSPNRFGFDFEKQEVTFYGEGQDIINVSTYDQCARAVAKVLSLKIRSDKGEDQEASLSDFRNKFVYLSSFAVSQRDIFDSVLQVTGQGEKDWTVNHVKHQDRYDQGLAQSQQGDREGYVQALYVRMFFPGGEGHYQKKGLWHNEILDLPQEDLDEATARSIELARNKEIPY